MAAKQHGRKGVQIWVPQGDSNKLDDLIRLIKTQDGEYQPRGLKKVDRSSAINGRVKSQLKRRETKPDAATTRKAEKEAKR
jgi:hypothetical protein